MLVTLVPKLVHAIAAACLDTVTYYLALVVFRDRRAAAGAFLCQLVSWFNFFGMVRPFSNSLEAALCGAALLAWLRARATSWNSAKSGSVIGVGVRKASARPLVAVAAALAALSVLVRPTAVLVWVPLCVFSFVIDGVAGAAYKAAIVVPVALGVLALGAGLDHHLYGSWTLPLLSFFRFNLLQGNDALYGVYPPHWYLIEGIPAAAGVFLPLLATGVGAASGEQAELAWAATFVLAVLSTAAHKEHRFLLPLAPIISVYAGRGLVVLYDALAAEEAAVAPPAGASRPAGRNTGGLGAPPRLPRKLRLYLFNVSLAGMVVSNLIAGLFINLVHQRDPVRLVEHIAASAEAAAALPINYDAGAGQRIMSGADRLQAVMEVHFLTPCHATPFYSVVHAPVAMLQLECSPGPRLGAAAGVRRRADASGAPGCLWDAAAAAWPALSETDAWLDDPAKFLVAAYGLAPVAPAACGATKQRRLPVGGRERHTAAAPTWSLAVAQQLSRPAGRSQPAAPPEPEASTFLTRTSGFASQYLPASALQVCPVPTPQYRQLPSHIVMTAGDALLPAVRAFLHSSEYLPANTSLAALEPRLPSGRPADDEALVLFVHICWSSIADARHDEPAA
jgi:hypothetical protein